MKFRNKIYLAITLIIILFGSLFINQSLAMSRMDTSNLKIGSTVKITNKKWVNSSNIFCIQRMQKINTDTYTIKTKDHVKTEFNNGKLTVEINDKEIDMANLSDENKAKLKIGYILTSEKKSKYCSAQTALWIMKVDGRGKTYHTWETNYSGGKALLDKAGAYISYLKSYKEPENLTNQDKLKCTNKGLAGPFKVSYSIKNHNNTKLFGGIKEIFVVDQNGEKINSDYWYVADKDGKKFSNDKYNINGSGAKNLPGNKDTFYIKLDMSKIPDVTEITVKVSFRSNMSLDATYFKAEGIKKSQRFLIMDSVTTKDSVMKENTMTLGKIKVAQPDLVHQKYISAINGVAVTPDRAPSITVKDGILSFRKTVTDPVSVKNGDEVTYTIRVYNQGNKDYVGSKDYEKYGREEDTFESGLEFLPNNNINKKYNWKVSGNTATTDYLKNVNISKYTSGTPDYAELKIVFKVNADLFKVIKNLDTSEEPNGYEIPGDEILTNFVSISGKVWLDIPQDKSNTRDNVLGNEKGIPGVTVTLYNKSTNKPVTSNENGHAIQNPTVTDENGNYTFDNILVKTETKNTVTKYDHNGTVVETNVTSSVKVITEEYYVVFSYNGQKYINVTPLAKDDKANATAKELGKSLVDIQSKAKELDRQGFNNRFAEITKGQANGIDGNKYALSYNNTDKGSQINYYDNNGKLLSQYVINASTNGVYGIQIGENMKTTSLNNIHLGLVERNDFDLMLRKDLYTATVSINGKTETYNYNNRKEEDMNLDLRGSDLYTLGLHDSDINYTGDKKLEVYTTYRILVYNQSPYIGSATRIADYFDSNKLQFVEAYLGDDNGNKTGNVSASGITNGVSLDLSSNEQKLANNEHMNIYIKFKVNADLIKNTLNTEKELGIENYSEILSYKSYNENGTIAGKIDKDSAPGNFDYTAAKAANLKAKYEEFYSKLTVENVNELTEEFQKELIKIFEDDADRAPGLKITLVDERTLSGSVFEDNTELKDNARLGNGIFDEGEKLVKGATVQLIDNSGNVAKIFNKDTKTWNDATMISSDGTYTFNGFIPGDYKVRFVYGTENMKDENGVVKYNGQDYKSTIDAMSKEDREFVYWYTIATRYSDANDDQERRKAVNEYSKTIINNIATELANKKSDEFIAHTQMTAYTSTLNLEVEYARVISSTSRVNTEYTADSTYNVKDVDLGLAERARSELTISKNVENIKIVTQDGQVLADTKQKTNNVAWVRDNFVQAIVDENLLEGTTVQITYKFTIKNTGESDYNTEKYYIYGEKDDSKIVTTKADEIVDYISNSLGFDAISSENNNWEEISRDKLQKLDSTGKAVSDKDNLVSADTDLSANRTFIKAKAGNPLLKELKPGESADATMVVSTIIGKDNNTDDLQYDNKVEIVKTTNIVGRRSQDSIQGNLDPNGEDVSEPDSAKAESVTVIPPYGENTIYYVVGFISIITLGVGIFLIKKHVIK